MKNSIRPPLYHHNAISPHKKKKYPHSSYQEHHHHKAVIEPKVDQNLTHLLTTSDKAQRHTCKSYIFSEGSGQSNPIDAILSIVPLYTLQRAQL